MSVQYVMEKIEGSSSSTPCGHKCVVQIVIVKSVLRKNSCPMCRAFYISDDVEYIDNGSKW